MTDETNAQLRKLVANQGEMLAAVTEHRNRLLGACEAALDVLHDLASELDKTAPSTSAVYFNAKGRGLAAIAQLGAALKG